MVVTDSRSRLPLLSLAVIAAAVLVLSACGSPSATGGSGDSDGSEAPAAPLAGTSWVLESLTGPDGATVPAVESANRGSLAFGNDATFAGSTGCNRIAGGYEQDGSSLVLQPGPMTMMACEGPVAAQETAVLAALPEVASFTAGASLILMSADGATLLTYSPGLTSLAGTSWRATGINNGKEAVVSTAGTENVTAVFGSDGQLSGSGGCNSYTATYTVTEPDELTIGAIAATAKACLEESVTQIEQDYFAALPNVTTYEIEADRLTLRDASGAAQVTYARTS